MLLPPMKVTHVVSFELLRFQEIDNVPDIDSHRGIIETNMNIRCRIKIQLKVGITHCLRHSAIKKKDSTFLRNGSGTTLQSKKWS